MERMKIHRKEKRTPLERAMNLSRRESKKREGKRGEKSDYKAKQKTTQAVTEKKIHRPKKIKPLRREAPAFKERKVVKSKRNKHPFLMERKARGEIEGFKLTSHPNNSPKVVKLRDFPKSKERRHSLRKANPCNSRFALAS